jgi:lysophospholipase L1-like esterase
MIMRCFCAFLVALILPFSPSAAESQVVAEAKTANAPSKRIYVVAAMGDSLTDPKSAGGKYLEGLKARCPKSTFDSYGVGGNMVNMMRKRFLRDVYGEVEGAPTAARPRYTHVIVLGGIGDILSNVTAKRTVRQITSDLATMYGMARAHGAVPIALTLPPWGSSKSYDSARDIMTKEVNTWIRSRDPSEALVGDVFPLLSCGKAEHLCADNGMKDRLHWSAKGHAVVASMLSQRFFADCE